MGDNCFMRVKPAALALIIGALAFSSAWAAAPNPPWQFCIGGSCSALAGPDTPANFTAASGGATTISLSWSPGGNGAAPTAYRIARSLSAGSGYADIYTGMGTAGTGDTRTYSNTGRTEGVTYYYRIWAQSGAVESANYAGANATPTGAQAAADFIIAAGVAASTFDGNSATPVSGPARKVMPGDIVQYAAGLHGPRKIQNVIGTAGSPVIIRSDPAGQVIIRRSSPATGSFVFEFLSNRHCVLDGSTTPSAPGGFGFKIMYASTGNTDAPSAFLKFGDSTYGIANELPGSFCTIRYVDIDGGYNTDAALTKATNGIGISVNQHTGLLYTEHQTAGVPTLYRENITIEYCRVRNTEGEGMYIGPNWHNTTPTNPNPDADDLPLRNIEVRYNEIDYTGWDMCNCKAWIAGTNKIHHNIMRNGSRLFDPTQTGGITTLNCTVNIYNNRIENTANRGIGAYMYMMPDTLPFGPFVANIYNNIVQDIVTSGGSLGKAITIGGDAGSHKIKAFIYNNTVVNTTGAGISTASGGVLDGSVVANNLLAATSAITGGSAALVSNITTTLSGAGFVNGAENNFKLAAGSPARNAATGAYITSDDYDGATRPKGSSADIGAYEYVE